MQLRRLLVCSVLPWLCIGVTHAQTVTPSPSRSLTVDRDPSPSIDPDVDPTKAVPTAAGPAGPTVPGQLAKDETGRYTLQADAYEVQLNVSVLDATGRPADNLTKGSFHILEDGVPQTITGFRHEDLAVSIGLLIDSSASMYDKREAVEKASLEMVRLSNPKDEAFLVDFSSRAYIDQDFTSSVAKLQQGLRYVKSTGGTAAYDAVMASAEYLTRHAKNSKRVLVLVTDGEDNASRTTIEEAIRRVQGLDGPVIYCVGLLFGEDTEKIASKRARALLERIAEQTGGAAFFPKNIKEVDKIAAIVAEDIRTQYTIGYRSTNPPQNGGYRTVHVDAFGQEKQKLNVRTRNGYLPKVTPVPGAPIATAKPAAPVATAVR